jgi:hypothetical protein
MKGLVVSDAGARTAAKARHRTRQLRGGSFACLAAICVAVMFLAACGSGSSSVVRTQGPTLSTPPASPASPASAASAASSPARSTRARAQPRVSVRPSLGLRNRQTVRVSGSGFSANQALQVIQCAVKGASTGPGDCNLTGMLSATSDGLGRVSVDLVVLRGPFGTNNIICGARQACLVSVTQASLSPTEEADAPITFAPVTS